MRRLIASALCISFLAPSLAFAQDAKVAQAISMSAKFKPVRLGEAFNLAAVGFEIELYSPIAFIQSLAQKAKREMRPFGVADVSAELREDVWRIKVWPSMPRRINE